MTIVMNPEADVFGPDHVILRGRGRQYRVENFAGPMSIKCVRRGEAEWTTSEGRYVVDGSRYLTLNDSQSYTISIDQVEEAETFCVFFQSGFFEDVARGMLHSSAQLLDEPERMDAFHVYEALQSSADTVGREIEAMYVEVISRKLDSARGEARLVRIAEALVDTNSAVRRLAGRIDAAKASTRAEILRRLLRARSFIDSELASRIGLREIAREAAMSPYHLHRAFRAVFGVTVHAYQIELRLERAAKLLRKGELPSGVVGTMVGFESAPSFSALFRRRFGISPGKYRRSLGC